MDKQRAIELAHGFATMTARMELETDDGQSIMSDKEHVCWAIPPSQMQDYEIEDGEPFAIHLWDYATDHADRRGKWPSPEKLYVWNCHTSGAPAPAISLMPYRAFLAAAQLFHPIVKAAIDAQAAAEAPPPGRDPFRRTVLQPRHMKDKRSIITRHQEAINDAQAGAKEDAGAEHAAQDGLEVVPTSPDNASAATAAPGADHSVEADPARIQAVAPPANVDGNTLVPPSSETPPGEKPPVKRGKR